MDGVKLILNALFGLVIFCGILYLAYLSTRYIGKKYSLGGKSVGNLKILDSVSLGKDSRICIVCVGGRYFLIGITSHNISLLSELDEAELDFEKKETASENTMSFSDALKINIAKKFGKETPQEEKPLNEEVSEDDQSKNG